MLLCAVPKDMVFQPFWLEKVLIQGPDLLNRVSNFGQVITRIGNMLPVFSSYGKDHVTMAA